MADFKVLGTVHTAFAVSDLQRTIRLFRDFLGFELVAEDVGEPELVETLTGVRADVNLGFIRSPDGHMIELVEWQAPADRQRVNARICDTGAWHFALEVDNLEGALAGAKDYGLVMYNRVVERPERGARTAYFRDPDGITIELAQKPRSRSRG